MAFFFQAIAFLKCTWLHLYILDIIGTLGWISRPPGVRFHQELAPLSAELDEEELRAIRKALESGGKGSHQEGEPGGGGR